MWLWCGKPWLWQTMADMPMAVAVSVAMAVAVMPRLWPRPWPWTCQHRVCGHGCGRDAQVVAEAIALDDALCFLKEFAMKPKLSKRSRVR